MKIAAEFLALDCASSNPHPFSCDRNVFGKTNVIIVGGAQLAQINCTVLTHTKQSLSFLIDIDVSLYIYACWSSFVHGEQS